MLKFSIELHWHPDGPHLSFVCFWVHRSWSLKTIRVSNLESVCRRVHWGFAVNGGSSQQSIATLASCLSSCA